MQAFRVRYLDPGKSGLEGNLKNIFAAPPSQPDLKICDKRGNTAITLAIIKGHPDIAGALLRPGQGGVADDTADVEGNTVLHLLAADGNMRMLRHMRITTFNPPFWGYFADTSSNLYSW